MILLFPQIFCNLDICSQACNCRLINRTASRLANSPYVWRSLFHRLLRHPVVAPATPTNWLAAVKSLNPAWDEALLSPTTSEYAWTTISSTTETPAGIGGQDPKATLEFHADVPHLVHIELIYISE